MVDQHPHAAGLGFEEAYTAHRAAIVRYLRRRLGDEAAEDAAAEVFSRALARWKSYEAQSETPLPWFYGIAGLVIHERRRAEKHRLRTLERLAGAPSTHVEAFDPTGGLDASWIRVLRRLAPGDRDALLLIAWGELSYAETAQTLGIPVGTVRSRLARVRRQITEQAKDIHAPGRTVTGEAHG